MTNLLKTKAVVAVTTAVLVALAFEPDASAQSGLDDPNAIQTIIGSEVQEEAALAEADSGKVIAAIEKAGEAIGTVRKTTVLDKVDIVFLTDSGVTEGGPPEAVVAKLEENKEAIDELRQEIEGNAMLYHAIDSRQILVRDVLAVEFPEKKTVVIYAAAKPPGE